MTGRPPRQDGSIPRAVWACRELGWASGMRPAHLLSCRPACLPARLLACLSAWDGHLTLPVKEPPCLASADPDGPGSHGKERCLLLWSAASRHLYRWVSPEGAGKGARLEIGSHAGMSIPWGSSLLLELACRQHSPALAVPSMNAASRSRTQASRRGAARCRRCACPSTARPRWRRSTSAAPRKT